MSQFDVTTSLHRTFKSSLSRQKSSLRQRRPGFSRTPTGGLVWEERNIVRSQYLTTTIAEKINNPSYEIKSSIIHEDMDRSLDCDRKFTDEDTCITLQQDDEIEEHENYSSDDDAVYGKCGS